MKRILLGLLVVGLLAATVALSTQKGDPKGDLQIQVEDKNPWNHLRFNKADFRFAFVSDRTGGARPGVFERSVAQLNLLQPEFVLSVGDLIQGGIDKNDKIDQQWKEFQDFVARFQMPFFYVVGNHDISNPVMDKKWGEKFGRRHYHFIYKNVLFLLLNTEVKQKVTAGILGAEQIAYAKRVLEENRAVDWTIVVMHKPMWTYKEKEIAKTGWLEVEKALAGRKYTVFAGHKHKYERFVRQGQRYYMLATTGGGSKLRGVPFGEFDHVVWVTMKKDGPVLANIMLEGIFPEDLKTSGP